MMWNDGGWLMPRLRVVSRTDEARASSRFKDSEQELEEPGDLRLYG